MSFRRAIASLLFFGALLAVFPCSSPAQPAAARVEPFGKRKLDDVRLRDCCVLADQETKTYYLISATARKSENGRPVVIAYTSKDLEMWEGPHVVFETPANFWAQRDIWAPEIHTYKGKYYLFVTFDTEDLLPEQWRQWIPRVKRGSQVLVSDSPLGPYKAFDHTRSTLPPDMMTLDGTLYVEDGVPYMVFCHEWVQIKDGTVEYVQLTDDLSATVGEPKRLFDGSDGPWARKSSTYGCYVTDGCWMHRTGSGQLLMLWSSHGKGGYTTGIASSTSGKIAGPWVQQTEPLYNANGGHSMLFRTFDGQLMMMLHSPNKAPEERARFIKVNEVGDTLRVAPPSGQPSR